MGPRADVAARRDPVGARRGAIRTRRRRRSATSRVSFPDVRSERDISRLAQEVFALPGPARRRPRGARSSSRSTNSRRSAASTADRSSTRCAPPCSISARSGYVFAGSEPSLMERMLGPKRPFYKAGPVMRLEKIPADEFAAFIDARFAAIGHEARSGARRRDRRPRRQPAVRRAAARARNVGRGARRGRRKRATLDDLHQALTRLLAEQQTMFEAVWQRLTLAQRSVLRAVVLEEGRELLSADVRAAPPARRRHRPCRTRWPRCSAKISSAAKATATSSSIRCCANGSRAGRSRFSFSRSRAQTRCSRCARSTP